MKRAVDYSWIIRPRDASLIMYKNPWAETWRRLLRAEAFGEWASSRGSDFNRVDIRRLWRMRLLRADVISASEDALDQRWFPEAGELNGPVFADARTPWVTAEGVVGPLPEDDVPHDAEPLFHPYRLLVLRELGRLARTPFGRMAMFQHGAWLPAQADAMLDARRRATAGDEVPSRIALLNDIATVGALAEPLLMRRIEHPLDDAPTWSLSHWHFVADGLRSLGEARCSEIHRMLCIEVERLDPNESVLTLLRLTLRHRPRSDLHLNGRTDGALELRLLAEGWRRACESTFTTKWREEDELGLSLSTNYKADLFNVPRLLDADETVVGDFIRLNFVDPRPTVRVYCEGDTEFAFTRAFFDLVGATGVAVLPLRGHLTSKENLEDVIAQNDSEGVFTFIVFDGDVSLNVASVRRLASADAFVGGFLVSRPDLELGNFTLDELARVAVDLSLGEEDHRRDGLASEIVAAGPFMGAKAFEATARRIIRGATGRSFKKSGEWGSALFEWAARNRHPAGTARPLLAFLQSIANAPRALYGWHKRDFRVDASTGAMARRAVEQP